MALSACGEEPTTTQRSAPNLLLIVVDTLRADHSSAYGYHRETTPGLERIAEAGLRFESAYAPSATTAPSHATLFTGRYLAGHGVRKNGIPLADGVHTLAEQLRDGGYTTAGVVSSFVLDRRF